MDYECAPNYFPDFREILTQDTTIRWTYRIFPDGTWECNLFKFLMIGSAEKAGSGVNKIMSGWNFAHWRKPFLNVDSQPDRLTLELPMTSIIPDETLQKFRDYFGEAIDLLGKEELIILSSCQIEGETSNY